VIQNYLKLSENYLKSNELTITTAKRKQFSQVCWSLHPMLRGSRRSKVGTLLWICRKLTKITFRFWNVSQEQVSRCLSIENCLCYEQSHCIDRNLCEKFKHMRFVMKERVKQAVLPRNFQKCWFWQKDILIYTSFADILKIYVFFWGSDSAL